MPDHLPILVAESTPEEISWLSEKLRNRGWEVIGTNDAIQAVSLTLKHKPAAVVLGSKIPAGGALFVLKRLRSLVQTAHLPAIVRVRSADPNSAAFLHAGADACVFDGEEVCQALNRRVASARPKFAAPAEIIQDPERLAELAATGLLDGPSLPILDALTQLTTTLLEVQASMVSLVDKGRQFFTSQYGLPYRWAQQRQTDLSHSICQWVVSANDELIVPDTRLHPVLQSNQAVKELKVIAYAGVPLSLNRETPVGVLCSVDSEPREWAANELETLRDVGQIVKAYLTVRRKQLKPEASPATHDLTITFSAAATAAINAAARILRRSGSRLGVLERDTLFEVIDQQTALLNNAYSYSDS